MEKLLLVTTRGGDYSLPETEWMEMGARQLKALCAMFGIPAFSYVFAGGLDLDPAGTEELVVSACELAARLAAEAC